MAASVPRLLTLFATILFCAGQADGQALMYRFEGDNVGDGFGLGPSAARGAGDLNGDGYADVVVGAPLAGYVKVFSGQDGAELLLANGAFVGDLFGLSASCAGDTNIDGFCDVVVGAPGNTLVPGYARVYFGDADANPANNMAFTFSLGAANSNEDLLVNMHEPDNGFGRSVDTAYDFLLEGSDMVVIGADKTDKNGPEAGSASVWSYDATLAIPGFRIRHIYFGAEANLRFGYSVAGLRDANADGFSDFVAASFLGSQTEVHSGMLLNILEMAAESDTSGTLNPVLDPIGALNTLEASSIVGVNVRAAGDFDNDESEDIIVGGILTADANTAGARVYSGADGAALSQLPGDPFDFFEGSSVSGIGDTDHDGYDDVVVASFLTQQTRVFQGRTGNDLLGYRGETLANGFEDGFGFGVGAAGDVNADGIADWCLSTSGNTAHIYSGARFFLLGDTLTGTVAAANDADEIMLKGLAGSELKITMNGVTGGLQPKVAIFDNRGEKLATLKFQANANGQKKVFEVPETGYYRLVVTGRNDTLGNYSVDTAKSKYQGKNVELSGTADASEFSGLIRFQLDALCGAVLTAKIKPLSGYPTVPSPFLLSPFGLPIPLILNTTVKNGSLRIADVPLVDGFGTHEFWVYGGDSASAEVFYKIKTKQPLGTDTIDIDLEPPF